MFEGTLHQYPIYDAIAMGIQMMVFTYLLGGRMPKGATSSRCGPTRCPRPVFSRRSCPSSRSIVIGNLLYGAVFAPHLVTKQLGYVTSGTGEQLFPGVPKTNQDNVARRICGTSSPTVELYYDPFDYAIDDDPYPVWKRMRAEAPLYFNEKYNFYALSRYDGRGTRASGLADLSVRAGHHRGHPVQRHRGAAGHPAVRGPAAARSAPATAVTRLHTAADAGGRGPGARILCRAHWIPCATPTASTSSPISARSCRCGRSAICSAFPRKANSRSATATTRASPLAADAG